MKVLIFVVMYLLVGCLVDTWVRKGFEIPNFIMAAIWPVFLLISVIIMGVEKAVDEADDLDKAMEKTDQYYDCHADSLKHGVCQLICPHSHFNNERPPKCCCPNRYENGECPKYCRAFRLGKLTSHNKEVHNDEWSD